jgi:ATP-binding cassette subfamily C (CFTR/MRP) protein 1
MEANVFFSVYLPIQVVSIVIVIAISTPMFLAAILPLCFIYFYVQRYYGLVFCLLRSGTIFLILTLGDMFSTVATSRQLKRIESVTRSPIYAHFGEALAGVSSIRGFARQRAFIGENEAAVDLNQKAYYPSICSNRWLALR